jgi:hypothetical protein
VVTVESGGKLAPGTLIGKLNTGSVDLQSGSQFVVEITGDVTAGTDYDQLNVTGTVNLDGAILVATGTVATVTATPIILINNDGTDPIIGTFAGLPEGSIVTVNGNSFRLTYFGNDGNDVVLGADTNIFLDGAGNLVIRDITSTTFDALTIQSDTTNQRFIISDADTTRVLTTNIPTALGNGTNVIIVPFAAVTSATNINITTFSNADSVTLDFSLGNFLKTVTYFGGDPATGSGDRLSLTGGTFTNIDHSLTNASDGSIDITGNSQIRYFGVEQPISDTLGATNRSFSYLAGGEAITVSDPDLGATGSTSIDSTQGAAVTFANPTAMLTINAGSGDDSVTIDSIDAAFRAATSIFGDGGTDLIVQNADLVLGSTAAPLSTGNLQYVSESIHLNGDLSSTGGLATYDGAVTVLSNVRVDTDSADNGTQGGNVLFTSAATINSEAGEANNLVLDAGSAQVLFNNNIGAGADGRIGRLEIEEANAGVVFGQSTPVNFVNAAGDGSTAVAIDIGSQSPIGGSGIVLNGGANPLVMSTTGDAVRFNGTVRMLTSVVIDTDSTALNTEGGDITFTSVSPIINAAAGNDLTLDAGTGDILFGAAIGNAVLPGEFRIDVFTIEDSHDVTFVGPLFTEGNISVVGSGDAKISALTTGATGTVAIDAGGAIFDNLASEGANITAQRAVLKAGADMGTDGDGVLDENQIEDGDLDIAVEFLTATSLVVDPQRGIFIQEADNILLQGVFAPQGAVRIHAGGLISIQNGTLADLRFVESDTGKVSNAPPTIEIEEADPDDVIVPGDPTQEVVGTIGNLGPNQELGVNFTIVATWDDGLTTPLNLLAQGETEGLRAGDSVNWFVAEDGTVTHTVTRAAVPEGPVTFFIQREYPLNYLGTVTETELVATFVIQNDPLIVLSDSRTGSTATTQAPFSLNQTDPVEIATTLSDDSFAQPIAIMLEEPPPPPEEPAPVLFIETSVSISSQSNRYEEAELVETGVQQDVPILFLVYVGPDGQEGPRVPVDIAYLRNIPALLERLKNPQIRSGLYRLYYQEPGLPPQKVLEVRKSGTVIGDPVREPGRGTNPTDDQSPMGQPGSAAPENQPANGARGGAALVPNDSKQARIAAALATATPESFTRAARLRRSLEQTATAASRGAFEMKHHA